MYIAFTAVILIDRFSVSNSLKRSIMKKLTFILGLLALSLGSFATEINEEVLKVFSKTYPGAQSVTWEDLKDSYKVFFTRNNVSYRIRYDVEGNVILALKYYGEENLSPLILNKVKKAYPKYAIHSVVEESSETSLIYHIILEGEKKLVTLKSDPIGYFEVESKYNKG
jgi:hypothetical protein